MLNIPTTKERLGKSSQGSPQGIVRYFVLLMALVYIGLGGWLWWTSGRPMTGLLAHVSSTSRQVLGGVFVLYGIVRLVRGYQNYFQVRKNDDSDDE